MNIVQYIIVNKSAANSGTEAMSTGKVASQAAHAAVLGYTLSYNDYIDAWMECPVKLVLEVEDQRELLAAKLHLDSLGFVSELVIDRGPTTEGTEDIATALAVELVDRSLPSVRYAFEDFKLYSDTT